MASSTNRSVEKFNYKRDEMPDWVREVIDTSLAIEAEDARASGNLGFMTRALVSATMPYKDPKAKVFERRNGDMTLSILSPNGVPFGKYPRLLVSYLVTEAVARRSREIVLGDTLADFLKNAVGVRSTGGEKGTQTRLSEQMHRLFTSLVTVSQHSGGDQAHRGFQFDNITMVERGRIDAKDVERLDRLGSDEAAQQKGDLWVKTDSPAWNSVIELTDKFFRECVETPVPIDLRAYKVLGDAPMAMDIYAWLTYRASYVKKPTKPIPWQALQAQFGSGHPFSDQGLRDFRKSFKRNLEIVRIVYPQLRVDESSNASGLVLLPSPTHVPKVSSSAGQKKLF